MDLYIKPEIYILITCIQRHTSPYISLHTVDVSVMRGRKNECDTCASCVVGVM